jgi:hypothetical protein
MKLPYFEELEIEYLGRMFENTSECYKFFWFKAIVTKILEGKSTISYEELIDEMIADAWYMVTEYHLKLGPKDTLEILVLYMQKVSGIKSAEKKDSILDYLKNTSDQEIRKRKRILTYNVPYRLQAPFMELVRGDVWKNSESTLAAKINQEKRLMYYFSALNGMNTTIIIQKDWEKYIIKNQEIIKGWLEYNIIIYLQRKNPSVPGIADKLYPPQERKLEKVKKYWKLLLSLKPVYDIYGHELLTPQDISIDHFVPWSYVAHDELWNLHPTIKSINSSKSNKLPDWETYFPRLSQVEYFSYEMIWKYEKIHKEFEKCAREHLNNNEVRRRIYRRGIEYPEFSGELENVLHPVYQSAKNCGFRNWIYGASS